jgi:hypothetical protein
LPSRLMSVTSSTSGKGPRRSRMLDVARGTGALCQRGGGGRSGGRRRGQRLPARQRTESRTGRSAYSGVGLAPGMSSTAPRSRLKGGTSCGACGRVEPGSTYVGLSGFTSRVVTRPAIRDRVCVPEISVVSRGSR